MSSEFPKHYDHLASEKHIQELWEKENLYVFDAKDTKREIFSVDTPPPYVSADHLHVGHAMSYSQAEFVVRYQRMKGKNVFYPMGFDDNGLPTERFVEKKYEVNKGKIKRNEFVDLCLKETALGAKTYQDLWRALGISVDWQLSYSTIDPHCRKTAQKSFLDLFEKHHIERREEPILWCLQCQTSLAQADVETVELNSSLHDIAFQDPSGNDLIISTTRPELIPACVALYVNPTDERYAKLLGQEAIVPILGHRVPIKGDESVEKEFGTGLMMVCTWGDVEDVRKWKEHGLPSRVIFQANGTLNEQAGPFKGLYYSKARKAILEKLKETGQLRKTTPIAHHVGVHERCDTPIDFMIAPQWFIKTLSFKEALLKRGDELRWFPEFMKVRYEQWVRDLKWDWNISRQRYYGVPFPVWYCEKCKHPVIAQESQLPVDPTVDKPPVESCPKCTSSKWTPEADVMDTWMTSSLTPLINARWAQDKNELMKKIYPMSVRPQAFEIIRTWLFYTVLKSHLHTQSVPWKDVMISGWGLDPQGKKISKRSGNFVDAHEVIRKYSADALRFWAAGSTLGHDLRYSERDVSAGRKIVVKLWNAFNFTSSNLKTELIEKALGQDSAYKPTVMIDHWVLSKLARTIGEMTAFFEAYEYSHALRSLERFFWATFCDNYLEIVKDRFWNPDAHDEKSIASAHMTLYVVSRSVLKLFAPFLPFITEELWQRCFRELENTKSIHIASWPASHNAWIDEKAEASGDLLLNCLTPIRKFKSDEKIHQNTQIPEVLVIAPTEKHAELQNILNDLASAARAQHIAIATESKTNHPIFETQIPNLRVQIQKATTHGA